MSVRRLHFYSIHFAICLVAFSVPARPAQASTPAVGAAADPSATPVLPADEVRAAIAKQEALISACPTDAASYVNLAYTLTDAGLGDEASDVMRKAIMIAPRSAFVHSAAGWVFHHNSIGVNFGKGYDYEASVAAFRKAIELAPNDSDARQSLANELEFNEDGIRYGPGSHLTDAIEMYRAVQALEKTSDPKMEDNLLFDLFYSRRFKDVIEEAATQPATPVREGIVIAAIAASQDSRAAIAFADAGNPQQRSAALELAAKGLLEVGLYPQAADLDSAALVGQDDSGASLRRDQILRTLRPFHGEDLPPSDPRNPVQRLMSDGLTGTLTEATASALLTRHAFSSDGDWQHSLGEVSRVTSMLHALSIKTGLPPAVFQDAALGTMKILVQPTEGTGRRIVVQIFGLAPLRLFVANEDGVFKIVATGSESAEVGNEALYLLHHGNEAEARSLLDWKRDQVQNGGGDDALGGVLFARFWKSGESKGSKTIETAAASLLIQDSAALALLPELAAEHSEATPGQARTNLDLLMAYLYLNAGDGANAKLVTRRLLKQYPDSATAIRLAGRADGLVKDWPSWDAMLDLRLQKHPNDRNLLLRKAEEEEAEGNFLPARKALRTLLDSGNALAADYNAYAWLSLFSGAVDTQAVEAAKQANLLTKEDDFAGLHTLACLYAAQGKTLEARQLLLQAMSSADRAEPNGPIWYGFGLIYEQYGDTEAAIGAYERVKKPEGIFNPVDTFVLAQARLKALHASGVPQSTGDASQP